MGGITYKLEKFEGPLDLLLSLIVKNKINIDDIPISLLCDQYMEYINAAEDLNIELSSEFIVMASELMLIKSRMLLPRTDENEEDPRASLAAAVLEYKRAKEASALLREMFDVYGARMAKETDEVSSDKSFVAEHDANLLSKAFISVMSRIRVTDEEARENFKPLIEKNAVSVASVVKGLAGRFSGRRNISLGKYFETAKSKAELVTMFLAMLELLKSGYIELCESEYELSGGVINASGDIEVTLKPEFDASVLETIIIEE